MYQSTRELYDQTVKYPAAIFSRTGPPSAASSIEHVLREHYLSAVAVYDDDLSSARYNHTEQIKLIMELKETLTTEIEFRKTVRRELMEATRYTKQLQTSSVELLNEKEKLEQVVSNLLDTESQDTVDEIEAALVRRTMYTSRCSAYTCETLLQQKHSRYFLNEEKLQLLFEQNLINAFKIAIQYKWQHP